MKLKELKLGGINYTSKVDDRCCFKVQVQVQILYYSVTCHKNKYCTSRYSYPLNTFMTSSLKDL